MSNTLPNRIHGIEMEYGPVLPDLAGSLQQLEFGTTEAGLMEFARSRQSSLTGCMGGGYFFPNGSRIYLDGYNMEAATSEDNSFLGTAANIRATWQNVTEIADNIDDDLGLADKVRLYHRVIDDDADTSGYHENFMIERDRRRHSAVLIEKVTSNILTGAGYLDRGGNYQLGQKALEVWVKYGVNDVEGKPILRLGRSDFHDADRCDHKRLEVTSGDATMSPWATRMALGKTSLVLRLDEYGISTDHLMPQNPAEAMLVAGKELGSETFNLDNGSRSTAYDTQLKLVQLCKRLATEVALPDEELWTLQEWEKALADFQQDPNLLRDRADWVAKKLIIEGVRERHGLSWVNQVLRNVDREWHRLGPGRMTERFEQGAWIPYMPDAALIARRVNHPPENTRAAIRGKAVQALGERAIMTWNSINVINPGSNRRRQKVPIDDPYATSSAELDAIISTIAA